MVKRGRPRKRTVSKATYKKKSRCAKISVRTRSGAERCRSTQGCNLARGPKRSFCYLSKGRGILKMRKGQKLTTTDIRNLLSEFKHLKEDITQRLKQYRYDPKYVGLFWYDSIINDYKKRNPKDLVYYQARAYIYELVKDGIIR